MTSNVCQDSFKSILLVSYLRAWIMSTLTLEDVLGECGVDPALASQLASEGWTIQTFSCIVSDVHEMDSHWQELVPDVELTLLQKAQFRAAFRKCLALQCPDLPEAVTPGQSQESQASASWSESFAPKLDSVVIDGLKSKFLANYPSELLNQDTMPSTRLLSLVYHQIQKKRWSWIPWKYRLTVAKSEEVSSQRQSKLPKLEVASLHHLLVDDPPSIDVSNTGMGLNGVRNLLAVHDVAIAMCGGAHLANLKAYSAKFLGYLTQRVDPESMLRCASIIEAQSADRQIWGSIADLMSERKWGLDDCLHEFTHIRRDLPGLLQLRPRPPKATNQNNAPWSTQGGKNKGKGKPFSSKGKGKGKGPSAKGKTQWITEFKTKEGQWKQLCMRYQTGACTFGDSCKFHHGCAYPVDGRACGQQHGAQQHQSTSH